MKNVEIYREGPYRNSVDDLYGWTRRTMLRDAWTNDGGKGWWRCWSRLGGLLAMATAISCLVVSFPGASANPEAKRLYDDLLSNYNRLIRPVGNNSDRLTVKMGLRLSQLIDVTK
ncbi:acetylcholine receptor subunit alpha-like 1 isoform X1 [Vespula squamosa]|uniref:Acetylcholine receptor subunit alpha-like 1 isoform X1 n=1 Tax=Vespula squamosa TaxID=30214 RepID=A0ABD2AF36_VESSQ